MRGFRFCLQIISAFALVGVASAAHASREPASINACAKYFDTHSRPATYANPQIKIWSLFESGQTRRAEKLLHAVTETLLKGEIVSVTPIGRGRNGAQIFEFADGTKGVWKASAGDHGIFAGGYEIVTYLIDRALGLNAVPVTVERTHDGVRGTIQLFVENRGYNPHTFGPIETKYFDFLIRNLDRKADNYLTFDGRPILIDHGLAFSVSDFGMEKGSFIALVEKTMTNQNTALARKDLAKLLPNRDVAAALRRTTPAEWQTLFAPYVKLEYVSSKFLWAREEILEAIDLAQRHFGPNILREGPITLEP